MKKTKKARTKAKKKGFTLIELLVCIGIISIVFIIIGYRYTSSRDSATKKMQEVENAELLTNGSLYYKEYENSEDFISYTDDTNTTYSCIRVQSLIDKGYYKNNIKFLDNTISRENTVVKIIEKNGIPTYELVKDYKRDKDCIYYDTSSELTDEDLVINNGEGEVDDKVSLSANISSNPKDKNSYILKLKFTADVFEEIQNIQLPAYVLMVMDVSGSMEDYYVNEKIPSVLPSKCTGWASWFDSDCQQQTVRVLKKKYSNARDASISLTDNIIDKFDDSQVSLINFSLKGSNGIPPTVMRGWAHQKLKTSDFFYPPYYGTDILGALNLAYNEMSALSIPNPDPNGAPTKLVNGENAIKYVVFLTDGKPEAPGVYNDVCRSYTTACANKIAEAAGKVRDEANFVVIGYDLEFDAYKTLASLDEDGTICPESDSVVNGKKYCYYNSDSDNVAGLFDSISSSIESTVNASNITKSEIRVQFDKSIKLYDSNNNLVDNLSIDIDFSDYSNAVMNQEYTYILELNDIDDNDLDCDLNTNQCTYNAKLFEDFYIEILNRDGTTTPIALTNSPYITVHKQLKSYVN